MDEEREPKIGFGEAVLIATPLLALEIISGIFVVVGPWILNIIVAPSLGFYLKMKGVPLLRPILMWIAEWIPFVNSLPLHTVGFLWAAAAERSETVGKITQEVGRVAGAAQKVGAAGGAPEAAHGKAGEGQAGPARASAEAGTGPQLEGAASGSPRGGAAGESPERPALAATAPEGEQAPGAPPQEEGAHAGKAGTSEDLEKREVETFGAKPEPLSRYETEEIVSPSELKDIEPPRAKKR